MVSLCWLLTKEHTYRRLAVFSSFVFGDREIFFYFVSSASSAPMWACVRNLWWRSLWDVNKSKCIQASHVCSVGDRDGPQRQGDADQPVASLLCLHLCHLTSSSLEVHHCCSALHSRVFALVKYRGHLVFSTCFISFIYFYCYYF